MPTEQERLAAQIRQIPAEFRIAITDDDQAMRHRPAQGEWSAIEVLGHMIDKMWIWAGRVERLMTEERPVLASYDQDALVRTHDYQQADPEKLFEQLGRECERFASLVERVPDSALEREGIHEEFGPMTIHRCISLALASSPEHLKQLLAAQTSA